MIRFSLYHLPTPIADLSPSPRILKTRHRPRRRNKPRSESPGVKNYLPRRPIFLLGIYHYPQTQASPTNPSSKRAKTEAEKEQRRVERVIRNRNAAHASRERKRAEVDRLEDERNDIKNQRDDLARELQESRHEIQLLKDQVAHLSTLVTASNHATPRSFIDAASPTLTAQLFKHEAQDSLSLDQLPNQPSPLAQTAFPSPSTLDEPVATPSELTQHPAAMLCSDLQCHSEVVRLALQRQIQVMAVTHSTIQALYLTMISAIYSTVVYPMIQIFISLKLGKPLISSPTELPMILTCLTWLISRPSTTLSTLRSTFRYPLLHRLLTCTPALARPLRDATGTALRLIIGSKASLSPTDCQDTAERSLEGLMSTLSAIESRRRRVLKGHKGTGLGGLHMLSGRRREKRKDLCNRRSATEFDGRGAVNVESMDPFLHITEQLSRLPKRPKDLPDFR
jgi:transcriptional activator HAC1